MSTPHLQFIVGQADVTATFWQGNLCMPFSRLVRVFGEPDMCPYFCHKVTFRWRIEFDNHVIATVQDWKASSLWRRGNPTPEQMRTMDYDRWCIGGNSRLVVKLVQQALQSPL